MIKSKNRNEKNTQHQREYKARMYAAGYKQVQVWVKREEGKGHVRITRKEFILKVDELTTGLSKVKLSELYKDLIRIIERKKRKEEKEK